MAHKATWRLRPYENTPEWQDEHKRWREAYNTCAECGSTNVAVYNRSAMWGDGDVLCENGHYVRMWDSG